MPADSNARQLALDVARVVADGIEISLRVAPSAKLTRVVGRYGERLKVQVAAPPADGRANDAVRALIAATLAVPHAAVTIVRGLTSRDKVVHVRGRFAAT